MVSGINHEAAAGLTLFLPAVLLGINSFNAAHICIVMPLSLVIKCPVLWIVYKRQRCEI